jgi:hypothetical protein
MEPWEEYGELWRRTAENSAKNRGDVTVQEWPPFPKAIMDYLVGDHSKIVDYLCSHQLSRNQQAELAWAIEEWARVKMGRPESLEHMNRKMIAENALQIFNMWKMENARRGIKDWDHRAKMKYRCCEIAVEEAYRNCAPDVEAMWWRLLGAPDVEAIWQLVNQPKSRRK